MAVIHETLGAHIRNILGPYSNLVQILSDLKDPNISIDTKNLLKNFLFEKIDPKNLEKNLNHFIEVSNLKEVEDINWRATELCEKYYKVFVYNIQKLCELKI